jgi:hypothetical protein
MPAQILSVKDSMASENRDLWISGSHRMHALQAFFVVIAMQNGSRQSTVQ